LRNLRSDTGIESTDAPRLTLRKKRVATAATALTFLAAASVVLVTDLRARSEVRRTTFASASTQARLEQRQTRLRVTQAQTRVSASDVQTLGAAISQTQTSLSTSNAAISSTERGLYFGGFDVAALNTCLSGVTQALDQVAVGQTTGALSSLGSVATSCNTARPAAG
jgi:hypothetical protein